jgi:hypothetical protein
VDARDNPRASDNPWSIRQALIYQKTVPKAHENTYIFVRLSETLGNQFSKLLSKKRFTEQVTKLPQHWTEIQALCIESLGDKWREYINWLDQEVSVLVRISKGKTGPSGSSAVLTKEIV